jgi:arsenite methyltransferase
MSRQDADQVRGAVREAYGKVAERDPAAGCTPGCCGPSQGASAKLGYSQEDLASVPEGSDLGLGCGNPQVIAALRVGETVVDLGSGAGFDCFLAARQVGPTGQVIGVDMTPAMLTKARVNAQRVEAKNVDFRLGEIERLPVGDCIADVVLSNCVINLSPDKPAVFREAFRVLKPGGRLAISDVVSIAPIPEALRKRVEALTGCISGAAAVADVEQMLREAGFVDVRVTVRPESKAFIEEWLPGWGAEDVVSSASIEGAKPASKGACCEPSCCGSGGSS